MSISDNHPLARLTAYPENPHTHTPKQLRQITASIEEYGRTAPIIIDEEGRILAGVGRLDAAKRLGIEVVPTYAATGLTDGQKRAYLIADNKLTENAGWNLGILGESFAALQSMELGFDLDITGFETPEIDLLILGDNSSADPETAPCPRRAPPSQGPATSGSADRTGFIAATRSPKRLIKPYWARNAPPPSSLTRHTMSPFPAMSPARAPLRIRTLRWRRAR